MMSSNAMTPFRRLGWARKFTVLRRTIVCWDQNQAVEHKRELKKQSITATGRKGAGIQDLRT